jgi:hypothetical protein
VLTWLIHFFRKLGAAAAAEEPSYVDITLEVDTLVQRDLTVDGLAVLLLEVDTLDTLDVDVL